MNINDEYIPDIVACITVEVSEIEHNIFKAELGNMKKSTQYIRRLELRKARLEKILRHLKHVSKEAA